MGSRSGFDANLEFDELPRLIDRGSGSIPPGLRLTNAATNLGEQTLLASADVALTNNITTVQAAFAAGSVISLHSNTAYYFEAQLFIDTGATTHTTAFSLPATGTALASIQYGSTLASVTSGTISTTAASILDVAVSTATVLNATSTATSTVINIIGTLLTGNGVVSLTPSITFSAGPTGTCKVRKGSFILFWPIVSQ